MNLQNWLEIIRNIIRDQELSWNTENIRNVQKTD